METLMRPTWTDERLDDLNVRVDTGFDPFDRRFEQVDRCFEQVDRRFEQADLRDIRVSTSTNLAFQRTMVQGFIALMTTMITGFIAVVGVILTQL